MPHGGNMQVSNALAEQRATKKRAKQCIFMGESMLKTISNWHFWGKRAQDDVKLLANRIALLKLEEKKVRGDS